MAEFANKESEIKQNEMKDLSDMLSNIAADLIKNAQDDFKKVLIEGLKSMMDTLESKFQNQLDQLREDFRFEMENQKMELGTLFQKHNNNNIYIPREFLRQASYNEQCPREANVGVTNQHASSPPLLKNATSSETLSQKVQPDIMGRHNISGGMHQQERRARRDSKRTSSQQIRACSSPPGEKTRGASSRSPSVAKFSRSNSMPTLVRHTTKPSTPVSLSVTAPQEVPSTAAVNSIPNLGDLVSSGHLLCLRRLSKEETVAAEYNGSENRDSGWTKCVTKNFKDAKNQADAAQRKKSKNFADTDGVLWLGKDLPSNLDGQRAANLFVQWFPHGNAENEETHGKELVDASAESAASTVSQIELRISADGTSGRAMSTAPSGEQTERKELYNEGCQHVMMSPHKPLTLNPRGRRSSNFQPKHYDDDESPPVDVSDFDIYTDEEEVSDSQSVKERSSEGTDYFKKIEQRVKENKSKKNLRCFFESMV